MPVNNGQFDMVNSGTVAELVKRCLTLEKEVHHWKSNHDNQVAKNKTLTQRPDLPIERVEAHRALETAESNIEKLRAGLNQAIELLVTALIEPEQITENEIHELRTLELSVPKRQIND